MHVSTLTLKNFRNYEYLTLDFCPGNNFITGRNGTGKTNILEALAILSQVKSFRNVPDTEIIQWGKEQYYCSAEVMDTQYQRFEMGCAKYGEIIKKKAKIDGKEEKKISDYFGKLVTIIFSPGDTILVYGSPDIRRRFFDGVISKIDTTYIDHLQEFRRILKNRNSLLKDIRDGRKDAGHLDVWDHMFADTSSVIMTRRSDTAERSMKLFQNAYASISGYEDIPVMRYRPSMRSFEKDVLISVLKKNRVRDIQAGTTTSGPQRDDFILESSDGRGFVYYASEGQVRMASVSLKVAEMQLVERQKRVKPILLVDDIMSQLDERRRHNVVAFFQEENQIIFTMVDAARIWGSRKQEREFYIRENARVEVKS